MNTGQVLRWADTTPQPWKNGSGVTRELAASPGSADFDWRLSIADVAASGSFSTFPNVERTIVLLEGTAMSLTVGGVPHELTRFEPFVFDGGRTAECAVPRGPTRDLNVMTRRGRCRGAVEVLDVEESATWQVPSEGARFVISLRGQLSVAGAGTDPVLLDRFDLLRLHRAGTLQLRGTGPVACIAISSVPNGPDRR